MTDKERGRQGIDRSAKSYPNFTPYLTEIQSEDPRYNTIHDPHYAPVIHTSMFEFEDKMVLGLRGMLDPLVIISLITTI